MGFRRELHFNRRLTAAIPWVEFHLFSYSDHLALARTLHHCIGALFSCRVVAPLRVRRMGAMASKLQKFINS
jgi:hypothetical protein